jgi:hypothetical protein
VFEAGIEEGGGGRSGYQWMSNTVGLRQILYNGERQREQ